MADDILNDNEFWKELGLDLEAEAGAAEERPEKTVAPAKSAEPKKSGKKPSKKKKTKKKNRFFAVLGEVSSNIVKSIAVVLCCVMTLTYLGGIVMMAGSGSTASASGASSVTILDKFDMFMTNQISDALDGVLAVDKVYWLSDSDQVAPEPKAENYGHVDTPADLMWLLEEAKDLIGDQELVFNADTPIWENEGVHYYYDETILVITWKQIINWGMYTMSEVRIAHPSQFRRFLAGGEFGSDKLYVTTDMAESVNAVVATSGDFYRFRRYGAVVYEGQLRRFEGNGVDTCFIDENGDLLFAYRGDLTSQAEALKFVEDHKIRFSLAFGPIMIDNGEIVVPPGYSTGEINGAYSRAALCQVDELHYLLVSAGGEAGRENRSTIAKFAKVLQEFGVQKAYALDGGQTTVIAMDGQLINNVDYGYQRQISDIIYFATAIPEGE